MAWETRKGTSNVYYTRSYRSDGDLVREYLGNGPLGREAAKQSDEIRELRDKKRRYEATRLAHFAAAERACDEYCRFVELALHAYMAECGYHYHRGEWRKRRVPKEKPAEEQTVKGDVTASGPSSQRSQLERSRKTPELRRRSMPKRRTLDCRSGLVRGVFVFRSASRKGVGCFFRSGSVGTTRCSPWEKSTRPLRLSTSASGRSERSCPTRTASIGRSQLPRPPPIETVTVGASRQWHPARRFELSSGSSHQNRCRQRMIAGDKQQRCARIGAPNERFEERCGQSEADGVEMASNSKQEFV